MRISRFRIGVVSLVALVCLGVAAWALAATTDVRVTATRVNAKHAQVDIKIKPVKCGADQKVLLSRTGWKKSKPILLDGTGSYNHVFKVPKKKVTFKVFYSARKVGHHPHFTTCSADKDSAKT
ncbi:MAG: hypothetical protein ABR600_08055 [Actinomycetota bacterium]